MSKNHRRRTARLFGHVRQLDRVLGEQLVEVAAQNPHAPANAQSGQRTRNYQVANRARYFQPRSASATLRRSHHPAVWHERQPETWH